MTYQVDLMKGENKTLQMVRITIECAPQCSEWIMALSIPLALDNNVDQSLLALPEALVMLGKSLVQAELPAAHWSQFSFNLVNQFIRDMCAYDQVIHFNSREWLEKFTDRLDILQTMLETEADQNLIDVVRSVANQIAEGQATRAQRSVYCNAAGAPLDFRDWAERVLENRLPPWEIEKAHLGAVDPDRLIAVLKQWIEIKPTTTQDEDEIPF